jgi:hypothetical protein
MERMSFGIILLWLFYAGTMVGQERPVLTRYDDDAGHWASVLAGIQTNGAPFDKRLSALIRYEYRFRDHFGLFAALQFWQIRRSSYDGFVSRDFFSRAGSTTVGMKLRVLFRYLGLSISGGMGSGVGPAPFLLFYSAGAELPVSDHVHPMLEIKRTTITEDSFFIMIGCAVHL